MLATVTAFSMLSVPSFAQGERIYTNSSEDFSEHVSYSVKKEALDNYAYMTEYAMENAGIDNISAEDIRLGEPFYIFSEMLERQEQIYYFPVLNSEDEFIYTLTVICTENGCQFSLNDQMVEQLNEIDYFNVDYIFYKSGENIAAESQNSKQYIFGQEFVSSFDDLTFEEKHTVYVEAASNMNRISFDSDCDLNDTSLNYYTYSPEFSEEYYGAYETELLMKLYNAKGQGNSGLCWAASVATTVNYINGSDVDAVDVAILMDIDLTGGGSINEVLKALKQYGVNYQITESILSFGKVVTNIGRKKPIIMACRSSDNVNGHMVTLVGCRTYKSNKFITIWNSATNGGKGASTVLKYDEEVSFQINASGPVFIWKFSVCDYI